MTETANTAQLPKPNGLEGVVAKRRDSRYRVGARSGDWIKLTHHRVQEVVVVLHDVTELVEDDDRVGRKLDVAIHVVLAVVLRVRAGLHHPFEVGDDRPRPQPPKHRTAQRATHRSQERSRQRAG